jgi:hypothetical protein
MIGALPAMTFETTECRIALVTIVGGETEMIATMYARALPTGTRNKCEAHRAIHIRVDVKLDTTPAVALPIVDVHDRLLAGTGIGPRLIDADGNALEAGKESIGGSLNLIDVIAVSPVTDTDIGIAEATGVGTMIMVPIGIVGQTAITRPSMTRMRKTRTVTAVGTSGDVIGVIPQ